MDKKLFNECILCKNIPQQILKEIEEIDKEIPESIFTDIFNSPEMESFTKSIKPPTLEHVEKKSVLLSSVKLKKGKKSHKNL